MEHWTQNEATLKSRSLKKKLSAGRRVTLKVKVSPPVLKALRKAVLAKRKTTGIVTLSVTGGTAPKPAKFTVTG